MTDQHDPDGTGDDADAADGPITPEVVRPRGAAARKRRGADPAGGEPADLSDLDPTAGRATGAPAPGGRPGTMVRFAAMALVAMGLMQLFIGAQWALSPDSIRCSFARLAIDDANDDDEDFNDVPLPDDAEDAGDVACDEAITLAGAIPADEDDEPDGEFDAESVFRTQGIGMIVVGLAQVPAGFLVLRTLKRVVRNIALGTAAAGMLLPALGILTLAAMAFVVFGLAFSRDAKAIWGGGTFLRPRPSSGAGAGGE